jgi:hypothetical protein
MSLPFLPPSLLPFLHLTFSSFPLPPSPQHFTLFPPSDASSFLLAKKLPQASYHYSPSSRSFHVHVEGEDEDEGGREGGGLIDWIDLQASREAAGRDGWMEGGRALHPLEVWVKEGEVLYLPALWFHEVTQTCPTIAGM